MEAKGHLFMVAEVVGVRSSLFGSCLLNHFVAAFLWVFSVFKLNPICWIFSWLCKGPRSGRLEHLNVFVFG